MSTFRFHRYVLIFSLLMIGSLLLAAPHKVHAMTYDASDTIVFADGSGLASKSGVDVNTASSVLQLTNGSSGFTAPFNTSGQATTQVIIPASVVQWGILSLDENTPTGTQVTVQVEDAAGNAYGDGLLPGNAEGLTGSSIDISALPVTKTATNQGIGKFARLILKIAFTTSNTSSTPTVSDIKLSWASQHGDLSSSTIASTAWAAVRGNNQATDQSVFDGTGVYPAIQWTKSVGASYGGTLIRGTGSTIYYKQQGGFTNDSFSTVTDGALMALNRDTGATIWSMPLSGMSFTNPDFTLSANGTIYNSDIFEDLMLAFDSADGSLKWTYPFYAGHGNEEAAIGTDGSIYTIRFDESPANTVFVYAFNPDGSVKWESTIPDPVGADEFTGYAISVASSGFLYFNTQTFDSGGNNLGAGLLYALDPSNGSTTWTYPVGDSYLAPVIGPDGTIYSANTNINLLSKQITAVNPDGTLKWAYSIGTSTDYWQNLTLRPDGVLLAERINANYPSLGGAIDAINTASGTLLWSLPLDNNDDVELHTFFSDAANGFYYSSIIYNSSTSLQYFNASGTLKWSMRASGGDVSFETGMQDESGETYVNLLQNGAAILVAAKPWTLSPSTDQSSYSARNTINFSVTTSMQRINPLNSGLNRMQAVLDDGTKVPMTYISTASDGDATWTASSSVPSSWALGVHSYNVQAAGAGVQTDIPVAFATAPIFSNNTGFIATSSFTITAAPTPPAPPVVVSVAGGGGGGGSYYLPTPQSSPASTTSAVSSSSLASLLASLEAQVQFLLAQANSKGAAISEADDHFTKDLSLLTHDPEVLLLQQFLNTHGFLIAKTGAGSPGQETDSFGAKTKAALIRYQKAYGISPASGYFGSKTRAYVNAAGD